MVHTWKTFGCAILMTSLTVSSFAIAQSEPPATATAPVPGKGDADSELAEIVVTGTLLRGIAPVGTNVIAVSRSDITATGAVSTQDLLATVPQISNEFNSAPQVGSGISGSTGVRPNIRNLAPGGINGGNTTLVLLNGHGMVGSGILQTVPDIGVIPPNAIERIDIVPDGGSSLYGSDAVGGIVNLITRKNLQGVEVNVNLGASNQYQSGEASVVGGDHWSGGSFLIALDYRANSDLLGANRAYYRSDLTPFGGSNFDVTTCQPGNVTANGVNYALPGRVPNATNLCDPALASDIFPRERQYSAFARIEQQVSDVVDFDATVYYANRFTTGKQAQDSTSGVLINSTNPYFQSIAGETSQSVAYSYAAAFGPSAEWTTKVEEYGVTPEFTIDAGHGWKVTALGNFGHSVTTATSPEVNSAAEATALSGTTLATALDPYDIAASNPAVLQSIVQFAQQAKSTQELGEGRVIADGTLFTLPGGAMRLAVGAQYTYESNDAEQTDSPLGDFSGAAHASANRSVYAAFGELLVPIVGAGNAIAGMQQLSLDASGRYDHYSDFGSTKNPKIGLSYMPFHDLTIRGNWGSSYNAPSLADTLGAVDSRAQIVPVSPWQKSFSPTDLLRPTILLAGGNPHLDPQTADTYSIGADYLPAQVQGLKLGITYWNVHLKDIIEYAPFSSPALFNNPGLASFYIINPTLAQVQGLVGNEHVNGPSIASLYASGNAPYIIINAQRNNLGSIKTNGLDFNGVYSRDTILGTVSASIGGTLTLSRMSEILGGAPFDELEGANISPLQLVASLGTRFHGFTARIVQNYSAGYPVAVVDQTRVGAFHPLNLFFAYDIPHSPFGGTQVTLNIDNIADESPPFYNALGSPVSGFGIANGSTFGRFFNLGIHQKF